MIHVLLPSFNPMYIIIITKSSIIILQAKKSPVEMGGTSTGVTHHVPGESTFIDEF